MKNRNQNKRFTNKVVSEILAGIREGLTKFSGPSRVAVIYRLDVDDDYYVCDPARLLNGHETKISAVFYDDDNRPTSTTNDLQDKPYSYINRVDHLELDGIISVGGKSGPVPFQMWFTDHHPEILSTGPTRCWLEHAALRFSHDIANDQELYSGISGRFLSEYATYAVHDHIINEFARSSKSLVPAFFSLYPVLNEILAISKTREELQSPHGELAFVLSEDVNSIDFLARFREEELPQLDNPKHVRKLLQAVQKFRNRLVSDSKQILGISRGRIDPIHLIADFRGSFGFLRINDQPICSFADGAYSSATHQAKLFQIEETLLDYNLDSSIRSSLYHIISSIVHYAETEHFGCAVVLDLNDPITHLAGQNLEQPLDLERSNLLDLACDLARVDGALQIGTDRKLHRFACLLDGSTIPKEDRSRGARYNSSLRFTAQNPDTIIVTVSADRPVSVIRNGSQYVGVVNGKDYADVTPQVLQQWLTEE